MNLWIICAKSEKFYLLLPELLVGTDPNQCVYHVLLTVWKIKPDYLHEKAQSFW